MIPPSLLVRPPLPHPFPSLQILRRDPIPCTAPVFDEPSLHFRCHAIQPQEARLDRSLDSSGPQARITHLDNRLQRERRCGTHPLPISRPTSLHSCVDPDTDRERDLHCEYSLHRLQAFRFRLAFWQLHRYHGSMVLIPLVSSPCHTRSWLGLGSKELRTRVGNWRWSRQLRRNRRMEPSGQERD